MKRLIIALLTVSMWGTSSLFANETDKVTADSIAAIAQDEIESWRKYLPTFKGTVRARYEYSPEIGKSRFQLRNARVGILGNVTDNISYKAELDLCDQGTILVADAYAKMTFVDKQYAITAGFQRLPISMDANRGPSSYHYANRSFVCKYVGNVRDVGVKLGYHPSKFPLNIEAGIFNGLEDEYTKGKWFNTMIYVARANYTFYGLKAEVSALSQKPDQVRMNSFDFALSWNYRNFYLEAEYMNKHYTNDAFNTVHTYNIQTHYRIPFRKVLTHMLVQARWDSMTDYWDGRLSETTPGSGVFDHKSITPGRDRLTVGVTFAHLKKFGAQFRINYEKYFYHDKTAVISDNDRDKILGELVVTF